ncbi:MFS transporter [Pseudoxanthomonas sp. USHLN014]|uniref:MFS transporter n=1 Tax=Pseudoxanthomonas sp. USHLN014 TaxID=3081297 RepID=UPI00301C8729
MSHVSSPSPVAHGGLLLLAVCAVALAMPLSFSAGALAVPAIAHDLRGSAAALNWVTNAFMLAFGSLLMVAGALADRFGRRRLFLAGTAGFAASSVLLCLAPSLLWLDLLRACQGVAAAASLASGSAALAQRFEGPARLRAFSLLGTTFGTGLAIGPLLAGSLVVWLGWRAVFAAGALLAGPAWWLARRAMRESRAPSSGPLDWPGAAAFTATVSLLTLALMQVPLHGWLGAGTLGCAGASLALLALFIAIECRRPQPMLDLSLFRYARFVGVQVLPVATCYGYVVLLVLLPLHLIGIEGLDPARAGLVMLALSAPMLGVPMLAARLAREVSAGALCGLGLLVAALGLAWLASRIGGPPASLVAPLLVIGAGTGLPWGLMDALSVSVVPTSRAGMAAGIFGTMRVAGEGIALALVGALLAALSRSHLVHMGAAGDHAPAAAAALAAGDLGQAARLIPTLPAARLVALQTEALQLLLWVLCAITGVAALVVLVMLRRPAAPSDARATASA